MTTGSKTSSSVHFLPEVFCFTDLLTIARSASFGIDFSPFDISGVISGDNMQPLSEILRFLVPTPDASMKSGTVILCASRLRNEYDRDVSSSAAGEDDIVSISGLTGVHVLRFLRVAPL